MMNIRNSLVLLIAACVLATTGTPLLAQDVSCIACDKEKLQGTVWKYPTGVVCEDCHALDRKCWICGTPAHSGFKRTEDGRYICRIEAANAITTVAQGKQVFQRTRNAVERMTRGVMRLKSPKISVQVFDVDYWNSDKSKSHPMHRTGIAHTRAAGKQMHHSVLLLSGMVNTNMIAVSAHEFTHLWINENKASGRTIEPQTVEAVCEIVAYKLAQGYKHNTQLKQIEKNPYTQGRITELIELEKRHGLNSILKWVARGTGARVTSKELGILSGKSYGTKRAAPTATPSPKTGSPLFGGSSKMKRAIPDSLELKAVIGSARRRMAMINGKSFTVNEEHSVPLGDKTVKVKCLKINEGSVVLQVEGKPEPVTLKIK